VLLSWSGLGYNSRALRLRQCAAEIVRLYSGKIPSEIDLLIKLPGIGKYTAHAIACFAFEQAVPLVDVNIARIVTRLHRAVRHRSDLDSTEMVWSIASSLLPTSSAYHWNQALMDFGSQICTARNPHCDLCVLQKHCASASSPALRRDAPVVHRKSEPSFGLIPRRIIRGRILKILHTRTISLEKLKSILRKWRIVLSAQNLEEIIHQMEKDGLVEISGNNSLHRISLAR
jgi:A/G-specific adenine glycosylase